MTELELDFEGKPIEGIKAVFGYPPVYLQLVYSLIPGAISRPECREFFQEMHDWLEGAREDEIRAKAAEVWKQYARLLEDAFKKIPPKKPWKEIAEDYWRRCRDKDFSWDTGLSHAWLAERFDLKAMNIWQDLPLHARIGIGHHAGRASIEEDFLLRDAFFVMVRARQTFEMLLKLVEKAKAMPDPDQAMGQMNALKQNVCTDCRLAVFSFYTFVECFVNSVGEDFAVRNPGLTARQRELLHGCKKAHYISTEKKIEKFAEIIRADGTRPLVLTDRKQCREPFTSFVQHVKDLRDATAHYAKGKAVIWLSPEKWIATANRACDTCMEVARQFWQACYPQRDMPDYLQCLASDQHVKIAEARLAVESEHA